MSSRFKGGRTIYLTEPQIRQAMSLTRSNQQAAVYLKVSFPTYKKYAKLFKDSNGISLFDLHKNQSGKGMVKPREDDRKFKLDDILLGKHPTYPKDKLFRRIIASQYMPEQCCNCGFHHKRATDLKMPLIMHHINGNATDHRLDNLELLCYNCYFLVVGNISMLTLRNVERYINTQTDLNVTYAAAEIDPENGENFDHLLSDQEKIDMIKAIKGI